MADDLLDLFLSTTEDYAIIMLDPDGRVSRWSRGAERLFGYSAEEVEGTLGHTIFVPPDQLAGVPEVELQQAAERGRAEDERWHLRKDGSRFWASGIMISLRDGGKLRGFAKVVRDFTERRRLDEAVRHTQKVESVGVLAAGVAHDFNNVLTAVLGNISLVRRRLNRINPDQQADELLLAAERAANRAGGGGSRDRGGRSGAAAAQLRRQGPPRDQAGGHLPGGERRAGHRPGLGLPEDHHPVRRARRLSQDSG